MQTLKLYTVDEVAEILRIHKETARQMVVRGEIQGTPMGRGAKRRKWLVTEESLSAFVRQRTEAATPKGKRKQPQTPQPKQWF